MEIWECEITHGISLVEQDEEQILSTPNLLLLTTCAQPRTSRTRRLAPGCASAPTVCGSDPLLVLTKKQLLYT